MKKTGPKKRFLSVEEREEEILSRVDLGVRGKLKELVDEFKDVFLDMLPKGRPPKRDIVHEIRTEEGAKPPSRPPYRLGPVEQDEMEDRSRTSLLRVSSGPVRVPMARQSYLSPKRTAGGVCALITGPSIDKLCEINSRCLALMHYLRDWARPRFLQSWTSHLATTRLRWKKRQSRKQLFVLTVATSSFSSCPLG